MITSSASERAITILVWMVAFSIVAALVWIVGDIVWKGVGRISIDFLLEAPTDAGRGGGIGTILVSTLLIVGVSVVVALPIGVGSAVFLGELAIGRTRLGLWVRRSLDALAAVPSIVFGLFGSAFFCRVLGLGFSILAGGLTLACMALPILIRTTEEALRAVPDEHRQAAAALGISRTTLLARIVLPCAAPGIAVGIVLGIGRAIAETAALLFTSGYVTRMPESLLDSGRALSVHIYDLSMNVPGGNANAYATALVLIIVLFGLNGLAVKATVTWARRRTG